MITELVINHTSDQHRWFQRARRAKPGSVYRDYYVWSDTDQKYQETRIIFIDTETSNWTWDPVAKAYFWHRFYSHQPDLNFDNPRVLREVLSVMHFWLEMGIDGLRLDAIPYLIERDGTNNENLPETHAGPEGDPGRARRHFPGRVLLAEANQWPEDVLPYFGDGDECHMAFHFPLMPRMYMAIAQEDRHPITDIMRQTPDIPESCQWAIFLRNHDELTLEMVTDRERDYLWNVYAADQRMRINLGIRRRLAPLLENDRRKIELMNSLLLSMPGTPIIYYGDEIGMGDNIFLGDRDGVRTPMQWSPDRNGGFSRADPNRLYLPSIMDPIYGFDAVNVEAQQRSPSSLLNWMKRLIVVRQAHPAFGRGRLRLLYPRNRKILAYLRERRGRDHPVRGQPRPLGAGGRARSERVPRSGPGRAARSQPVPADRRPALPADAARARLLLVRARRGGEPCPAGTSRSPSRCPTSSPWSSATAGARWSRARRRASSHRDVLPAFLVNQRWFAGKDQTIEATATGAWAELTGERGSFLLSEIEVRLRGAEAAQRYFMPLAVTCDDQALAHGWPLLPYTLAQARRGAKVGAVYDALAAEAFPLAALDAIRAGVEVQASAGQSASGPPRPCRRSSSEPSPEVHGLGVEQSNSSVQIGDQVVLKAYRQLAPGVQPEIEIGRFLIEEAGFGHTPPLLGAIERIDADGQSTALAAAFGFVRNQGDGWVYTLEYLERVFDELRLVPADADEAPAEHEVHAAYLEQVRTLGLRTAEFHRALAVETANPAFAAEPIGKADLKAWAKALGRQLDAALAALEQARERLDEPAKAQAAALLAGRGALRERIAALTARPVHAVKTRLHGDYHLGQVLVVENDLHIIDFEGEPARSLEERRAKSSPLKDVAGMLRSFDYVAAASVMRLLEVDPHSAEIVQPLAQRWREATEQAFLDSYRAAIAGCPSHPEDPDEARRLIDLFLLEKALYEICYEAANRPDWLGIPLAGVSRLVNLGKGDDGRP